MEAGYTAFSFSLQIVITSFSHPEITLVSLFYKQNFFIREYKLYENTIQAQMFWEINIVIDNISEPWVCYSFLYEDSKIWKVAKSSDHVYA